MKCWRYIAALVVLPFVVVNVAIGMATHIGSFVVYLNLAVVMAMVTVAIYAWLLRGLVGRE